MFPRLSTLGLCKAVLSACVGRQQWRGSRSCRPSGPCGSSMAGDTGDTGSASQALDWVCLLSGQTTQGFNAGSFLGACSSWPCCPARDGCAVVSRMGSEPGGQTPKGILQSPEPLMEYKSKIKKCERKMQRPGGSGEPTGKRVQRGARHGQGKGMGSELPGADTALDGTVPQHGKGLPALFWSLR